MPVSVSDRLRLRGCAAAGLRDTPQIPRKRARRQGSGRVGRAGVPIGAGGTTVSATGKFSGLAPGATGTESK